MSFDLPSRRRGGNRLNGFRHLISAQKAGDARRSDEVRAVTLPSLPLIYGGEPVTYLGGRLMLGAETIRERT